jgi:hypothetical protein
MGIINEVIDGSKIINQIQSSNIVKTTYDVQLNTLLVEFKNGLTYEYEQVPLQTYTQFRMAESQGKFFSSKIARTFKYKKL